MEGGSERGGGQEFGKNRELFNDFNDVHVIDFSDSFRKNQELSNNFNDVHILDFSELFRKM